jgi:hypothetical protein
VSFNNVVPGWLVPQIRIVENGNGYIVTSATPKENNMLTAKCNWDQCGLCYPEQYETKKNKNTPKEINVSVTLAAATKAFKDSVESRVKNDKATIEVNNYPFGSKTTATLNLYVPSAYGEGTYANVTLNADDLKQLQDAIYKARVEIAKGEIKNEDVYPF